MILASIEGLTFPAVLAVVILLLQWINGRKKRETSGSDVRHSGQRSSAALGSKSGSEEERMRRFLEALGIPADSPEMQRPANPPPLRPPERRKADPKPVPPIVTEKARSKQTAPRRVPPLPTQVSGKTKSAPSREERRSLDEAPAPTRPVRDIHVPEIETRSTEDFNTISSGVSAIPSGGMSVRRSIHESESEKGLRERKEPELWREALRSPEAIRSAFILKEVLSAPRGLQSGAFPPSFPLL